MCRVRLLVATGKVKQRADLVAIDQIRSRRKLQNALRRQYGERTDEVLDRNRCRGVVVRVKQRADVMMPWRKISEHKQIHAPNVSNPRRKRRNDEVVGEHHPIANHHRSRLTFNIRHRPQLERWSRSDCLKRNPHAVVSSKRRNVGISACIHGVGSVPIAPKPRRVP